MGQTDHILVHTLDCYRQAASLVGEAIALLLAANADEAEPVVRELRPIVQQIREMERR